MIGRGTRTSPGKDNLLVLDFLWLSREHNLIKPASLIAQTEREGAEIEAQLEAADGDLLTAESNAKTERETALKRRLDRQREEQEEEVDLLELANRWHAPDIVSYEAIFGWERKGLTEKQTEILQRNGVDLTLVQNRGHASAILEALFAFKEREPATDKQIRYCAYLGHSNPRELTKRAAGRWIEQRKTGAPT
jgi:hypothetical protein